MPSEVFAAMDWSVPNKEFSKLLTQPDRKRLFGRYIGADVKHFADLFVESKVFIPKDAERILEYKQLSHQTDALVETLGRKSFKSIDVMLNVLREAHNLYKLLEDVKIQVFKTYKVDLRNADFDPVPNEKVEHKGSSDKPDTLTSTNTKGESSPLLNRHGQVRGAGIQTDPAEQKLTLRDMVAWRTLEELIPKLKQVESLTELMDRTNDAVPKGETTLHAAIMRRSDQKGKCVEMLLKRAQELGDEVKNGVSELTIQSYIDAYLNDSLETAAHLAAKLSLTPVLLQLNEAKCDLFLKDKDDNTVLDLMNINAPEAACKIYRDAVTFNDDKTRITIDCSTVIGRASPLKSGKIDRFYEETGVLAKLIYSDPDGAKEILKCETVIAFVKLKWAKMTFWFWFFFILQVLFHVALLLFMIQVYVIDCRHSNYSIKQLTRASTTVSTPANKTDLPQNSWNYLVGTGPWGHRVPDPINTTYSQDCQVGSGIYGEAIFLLVCGVILLILEVIELRLKGCRYLKEYANYTQILNIVCIFIVTMKPIIRSRPTVDVSHSFAAFGAILSCILIVQQLGVVWPKFGTYVQSFGKVIKRLYYSGPICLLLFLGFAIAFSIQFPDAKPFQTLPQAILKMLVMGLGEFDHYTTLYEENGPWTPVAGNLIYFLFVTFVTVLLFSCWLVAITVLDVKELLEKAEVVQLAIQIDQIYFMETWLNFMRPCLLLCRKLDNFVRRKRGLQDFKPLYLDIHVISLLKENSVDESPEENSVDECPKEKSVPEGPEEKLPYIPMTIVKETANLPKELRNLLLKLASKCDTVTELGLLGQSKETAV